MKSKWQILAIPSDEDDPLVITEDDPIYSYLMGDYLDENGKIRKELFDEIDGKFYQKKGLVNVNGKLELPIK